MLFTYLLAILTKDEWLGYSDINKPVIFLLPNCGRDILTYQWIEQGSNNEKN